ncbi:putative defense protein 3 [Clavelina lepadiformis]|uniref:putative defense protein 3 n=1 Tax=Clavelina lepadiformis TaxID=159417 RepID=UPI0040420945
MKSFYVAIFVAYFYVQATSATPNGAPTKACTSMSPGHLVSGSTTDYIKTQSLSNSRYSVATMAKNYSAGSVVKVWIEDSQTEGYRGILLQARTLNGDSALGRWNTPPANTKLLKCVEADDAVTHSNTTLKTSDAVYEWLPSKDYGSIAFVATVAETHDVFWVQLKSSTLTGGASQLYSNCHLLLTTVTLLISTLLQR